MRKQSIPGRLSSPTQPGYKAREFDTSLGTIGSKMAKSRESYQKLGIKCHYLGNYNKKTHTDCFG